MNGDGNELHSDEDLARALRELPEAIEPPRDLWRGVADEIATKRRRTSGVRRAAAVTSAFLMAAAALLVVRASRAPGPIARITPDTIAPEIVPSTHVRAPSPCEEAVVVPEEKSFDTALAAMDGAVNERLDTLPAADRDAIQKSLGAIQQGIAATRASLEQTPDDPELRAELDDEYQQELQTLNDVLDWTTRS